MRVPRVYINQPLTTGLTVTLNAKTSNYLCNVLRMDAERELIVFCGDGKEHSATLSLAHKKHAEVTINSSTELSRESSLHTHLAIGISRGERFDFVLQKATELGITEITPLFTERTEVKLKGDRLEKKAEHWQQILISACEQCQRNTLPILNPATSYANFLGQSPAGLKLVLHHRSDKSLNQHSTPEQVTLMIGPEGGLSEEEILLAEANGFNALTLGPRVLRTETAPIVAISAVQLLWGDY